MAQAVCVYPTWSLASHRLQIFPGMASHENLQSVLRLPEGRAAEGRMPLNACLKRC
jgi:hypothetical protein